ncbi:hypothetical protein ABE10_10735, partial [Bacillus toyonensis]|nr:hypothetical protein [Bacillus toyonensis]
MLRPLGVVDGGGVVAVGERVDRPTVRDASTREVRVVTSPVQILVVRVRLVRRVPAPLAVVAVTGGPHLVVREDELRGVEDRRDLLDAGHGDPAAARGVGPVVETLGVVATDHRLRRIVLVPVDETSRKRSVPVVAPALRRGVRKDREDRPRTRLDVGHATERRDDGEVGVAARPGAEHAVGPRTPRGHGAVRLADEAGAQRGGQLDVVV